ncbi:lipocalin-like domain-containing protein [Paraburkholderia strydomiana]|uniref:lipocalin-like domain-containing protein n=1 Tax=Paraburkholderia strydomiana TaxID=1245417 RepID=UPI0038B7F202
MQRRLTVFFASTAVWASSLLAFQYAVAQTGKSLIGTWHLTSLTVLKSGSPVEVLGEHPEGQLVFGEDGRYTLIAVRANLPKLASGDRLSATTEESKLILQGSVAHFGTYVVDPTTRRIEFHIKKGNFPNWDDEIQARPFVIEDDRLTYITPGSFGYGASTAVWQRATDRR